METENTTVDVETVADQHDAFLEGWDDDVPVTEDADQQTEDAEDEVEEVNKEAAEEVEEQTETESDTTEEAADTDTETEEPVAETVVETPVADAPSPKLPEGASS